MSLAIGVGVLAAMLEGGSDSEVVDWVREDLGLLTRALLRHNIPPHEEPETLPVFPSRGQIHWFSYSYLHHLRRAVAYARQAPEEFATLDRTQDPTEDERLGEEYSSLHGSHVCCHSDTEGYYVPIDFADVIYGETDDDIPGGMLGSSYRVLDELALAAPLIDITLVEGQLTDEEAWSLAGEQEGHPYQIERIVWFSLWEAARLSVAYNTVITFS